MEEGEGRGGRAYPATKGFGEGAKSEGNENVKCPLCGVKSRSSDGFDFGCEEMRKHQNRIGKREGKKEESKMMRR